MRMIERAQTEGHPGHYSSAVACGGLLYISGQLPIAWDTTRKLVGGGVRAQAAQAFANLYALLEAEGLVKTDVVKTTVFVPDVTLWPEVDEEYAAFFGDHKPARSVVPTNTLHYGALVEIEAIARYGGKS